MTPCRLEFKQMFLFCSFIPSVIVSCRLMRETKPTALQINLLLIAGARAGSGRLALSSRRRIHLIAH